MSELSPTELLNHLTGRWELTGTMGSTPLRQSVEAHWTLGGLFVEMYFKSTLPAPEGQKPYEAVYFIGYNAEKDCFVLHLLDTFGVGTQCIVGVAHREGNSIAFGFAYESGPFTNRFTWQEATEVWAFEQSYVEGGERKVFAVKRMEKV